jgi:CheY-like chemotaxis protein/DNA-binding XRE family transcriptional regulator
LKQTLLGSCIRSLRIKHNLTQAQLADILGVTDKAVSKWERNLSYPDIALFPKLADVLETTVDSLLRECKEECRPSRLLKAFEMSRDIRMPLHIILGFVEIIRNSHDDPEMLQKYLDGIRISCEYMMTLLNRIQKENLDGKDREGRGEDYPLTSEELDRYLHEHISRGQTQLPACQFSGKRVLVADDIAVNREIAAEILKQFGAETAFAEDGLICLHMMHAAPAGYYDLILMDIQMPNMDGIEATRKIRQLSDPKKARIPIIALTANVSDKEREAALAAGMDAFEEKPIFIDKLLAAMRRYLYPEEVT